MINIFTDPISKLDVLALRKAAADKCKIEGSLAEKVAWFCPVPGLDMVAGLLTHAVESSIHGSEEDEWREVPGALNRDWSASSVAQNYVQKVREQGRGVVKAEVDSLESYLSFLSGLKTVPAVVAGLAKDRLK